MSADMDELIGWLRQQFDEDERVARDALHPDAVRPGVWTTEHHNSKTHNEPNRCHIAEDRGGHYWSVAHEVFIPNAEHMARWDPARVLAEVEAKRRILDLIENGDGGTTHEECLESALMQVVLFHVQSYAGQSGWREEWRA